MAKRGRGQGKDGKSSKRRRDEYVEPEDMDDEIDAFHKQRDIIPLDVNADADESSEDYEEPIFDDKDIGEDSDDLEENSDDDANDASFTAKLKKQQKFLRERFAGVDDDMDDDEEEEDVEKKIIWGGRKGQYYGGDNHDYELQSSDDEAPEEEEAEVLRLQREKEKSMSMDDFGIEEDDDDDEGDRELTLEEIPIKGKVAEKTSLGMGVVDDMGTAVEEIKKDLSALSTEEQMDIVYSSAPEVVGLLAELNDALEQLEVKVNPLLNEAQLHAMLPEGGMRYLEVKQLLLLAYCQAITFYLLLKSEGQPVRDHPVLARLVDIKGLVDKMKQLDGDLTSEIEGFLKKNHRIEVVENQCKESNVQQLVSGTPTITEVGSDNLASADERNSTKGRETMDSKSLQSKEKKNKNKRTEVGIQNLEMLKLRAALEEKLKQNGAISSGLPKPDKSQKNSKPVNRHLTTYDDFDDEALNAEMDNRGRSSHAESLGLKQISQLTRKLNKSKVVSGDDDLPKRDDIGERRRKHELRVLAGAGIRSEDDNADDHGDELRNLQNNGASDGTEDEDTEDSADDFYEQVKQKRAAKLAAKNEIYKRMPAIPSLPETVVGKRQISYQIEKNRGLTRQRKKQDKNPRRKIRTKHEKAMKRREGQVRKVRKPSGPYGGEATGINPGISRSIRL